ncbi:MAG: hypothetical protein V9G23_15660 [Giesbergeria sp.]
MTAPRCKTCWVCSAGKKMVLIDTTGVAPRDPRKRDMLEVLDLPEVQAPAGAQCRQPWRHAGRHA